MRRTTVETGRVAPARRRGEMEDVGLHDVDLDYVDWEDVESKFKMAALLCKEVTT
jgi:hypothetical protein